MIIESTVLAAQVGDAVVQNIIMVGALAGSGYLPIPRETFEEIITRVVPHKALELNQKAFKIGFETAQNINRA